MGRNLRGGGCGLPGTTAADAESAFAEIYRDHSNAVYGLVRRICGPTLAAEVTQDVFVHLWTRPDKFDPARGSLRSFLLASASGRAIDVVRSESARGRREERTARSTPVDSPEADDMLLERERSARIAAAISELPAVERDAIVSTFYGEVTYREAARILSVPEGTLKSRIRTGLMELRRALGHPLDPLPASPDGAGQCPSAPSATRRRLPRSFPPPRCTPVDPTDGQDHC